MKLSNNTYDILKNVALVVLPALATLWLTLAGIWGFPYGEAIAATITAIDVFLGAILKISTATYQKEKFDGLDVLLFDSEDHEPHRNTK